MKLHPGFELSCHGRWYIIHRCDIIVYDIVAIVVAEADLICRAVVLYYYDAV